ncbi:RING finger protein 24 isoform X2 [Pseudorasbora parva]|uniref:RING finger protein 24 isoform X2 n=1 Tax=Pseudorasbora parva TaxID=51549 RepID=UPI00351DB0F9
MLFFFFFFYSHRIVTHSRAWQTATVGVKNLNLCYTEETKTSTSWILRGLSMTSDLQHYTFRMPNIGFQNLPLNIYIVVFGTAIFVFILSLLFCCYLIRSLSLCCERLSLLVTEVTAPGTQRALCIQAGYSKGKSQRIKLARDLCGVFGGIQAER